MVFNGFQDFPTLGMVPTSTVLGFKCDGDPFILGSRSGSDTLIRFPRIHRPFEILVQGSSGLYISGFQEVLHQGNNSGDGKSDLKIEGFPMRPIPRSYSAMCAEGLICY